MTNGNTRHLSVFLETTWFVNENKSAHVTFTNRRTDCPAVTINGTKLPVTNEVKYLGLILDQKPTWKPHIIAKKTQINLKLRQMHWLIGRKSKLTTENKLLLYQAILKPIWAYGIQLWGCIKPSNTKIIQGVESKILRMAFNAPWYVSNKTLHESLGIPFVVEEIKRLTNKYLQNLSGHSNKQLSQLKAPPPRGQKKTKPPMADRRTICLKNWQEVQFALGELSLDSTSPHSASVQTIYL
jgi:hypothetical protein